MDTKTAHWESVYQTKDFDSVSWYAPHLNESLELIQKLAPSKIASIIDVGGGESTLTDDLIELGYKNLSVLDISSHAIDFTKKRLGEKSSLVSWHVGDVTNIALPLQQYDIWHDRAVFHFLTDEQSRHDYVTQVRKSVKKGGYVIMATFGSEGPLKCSGLDVVRYDTEKLHNEFGDDFKLLGSDTTTHETPFNTTQQFLYCWCRVE